MRTIADTPLGSVMGLLVLIAMFIVIWLAGDSSAGAGASPRQAPASVESEAQPQALNSARTHRAPVTHTSIPPARLRELQGR